jgi:hypothetical protein
MQQWDCILQSSPRTFLSGPFSFRLDSRLKHAGMTEKHWQPKEELEKTE